MKNSTIAYILFTLVFILSSCNDIKQTIKETQKGSNLTPVVYSDIQSNNAAQSSKLALSQKDWMQNAEQTLRNRPEFKGKSIYVYKTIHFYNDGRVICQLQNPQNPKYIDEYTFKDGQWQDPKPVRTSVNDQIEVNLVALGQFSFHKANTIYMSYTQKLDSLRAEFSNPNYANISVYAIVGENNLKWYPNSISTDRSSYSFKYDENGNITDFKQN